VPAGDVADAGIGQLDGGVVVGEVAAVLDDLTELKSSWQRSSGSKSRTG
jgi:hypothetical protein